MIEVGTWQRVVIEIIKREGWTLGCTPWMAQQSCENGPNTARTRCCLIGGNAHDPAGHLPLHTLVLPRMANMRRQVFGASMKHGDLLLSYVLKKPFSNGVQW